MNREVLNPLRRGASDASSGGGVEGRIFAVKRRIRERQIEVFLYPCAQVFGGKQVRLLWVRKSGKPIVFVQAFIDELYIASYRIMKAWVEQCTRRANVQHLTGKDTHMIPISSSEPLFATINVSVNHFEIDASGSVRRPNACLRPNYPANR